MRDGCFSMKRIFLTGASSGIGLATAEALVANGHEVWGTSRNPERLPARARLHPVRLDLRNNGEIEAAFTGALRVAGHFDVVINNAGSGHFGAAEILPALTEMRGRGAGLIVNVTSLASLLPVPFMAAYNAAKSAMAAFTMSIQLELGDSRVHIVDLQPGDICTNFNEAIIKSQRDVGYDRRAAKTWEAVERNMKAAPKPELVASYVVKLIDQKNPPPRVTVGDTFQVKIAPLIFRFLPQRVRIWGLKRYYGI